MLFESRTQLFDVRPDQTFESQHTLPGEERVESCATKAMVGMVLGGERSKIIAELAGKVTVFVAWGGAGIEGVDEVRVTDVQLEGVDADYWAFECVSVASVNGTSTDHIFDASSRFRYSTYPI
jgi:hypothetical protein